MKIQDAEAQKGYIDNTERLTRLQNEDWKARHDRAKQQRIASRDLHSRLLLPRTARTTTRNPLAKQRRRTWHAAGWLAGWLASWTTVE